MANDKTPWHEIARYAAACPSHHNTQPFRLRVLNPTEAEVIFLPQRGLPVVDPRGRFSWLCAGIFVEVCAVAAHALGFEIEETPTFAALYPGGDTETPQSIVRLRLSAHATLDDLGAQLILDRQTSRLAYDGKPVPAALVAELQAEAARCGHRFEVRTDTAAIAWVVELNRQALFGDMENEPLRSELARWLRYGKREEALRRDGMSARCLGFPAVLLKSFFTQTEFWTRPGIRSLAGHIYGRTMKGVGTIGWLRGPFATVADWFAAGRTMIRLWLIVTRAGYYWHPYGSVITSDSARAEMIRFFEITDEKGGTDMVWLLLRLGKSSTPPVSRRLPVEELLQCA